MSFTSPLYDLAATDFRRIPLIGELATDLAGKHLLLTGGTGFFGQWLLTLADQLNRQGCRLEVTVCSRDPARFLTAQPWYRECDWLHWFGSDVRELRQIPGSRPDLILHAAADTSALAHTRPLELFETITQGARLVLELAVRYEVERVLVTGSGAQYGALPSDCAVREDYLGACRSNSATSAYAEGKRVQETLAAIYGEVHGLTVVMTRCFAFSGPILPMDGHFAIGNFVRQALSSDAICLSSDGSAVRSYLHGADLAVWLLKLLLDGIAGSVYNVGSDQAIRIADLARRVRSRIAPDKRVLLGSVLEGGGGSFYVPDISRARSLGLDVWTQLDDSIDAMAAWARLQPGVYGRGC